MSSGLPGQSQTRKARREGKGERRQVTLSTTGEKNERISRQKNHKPQIKNEVISKEEMSQKAKQMVEEIQVSYKVECSLPSAPAARAPCSGALGGALRSRPGLRGMNVP